MNGEIARLRIDEIIVLCCACITAIYRVGPCLINANLHVRMWCSILSLRSRCISSARMSLIVEAFLLAVSGRNAEQNLHIYSLPVRYNPVFSQPL